MATTKQKTAIKKMSENVGSSSPKSMGKILRESGYSNSVSKTPSRVLGAKGWKELMEEAFPAKTLLQVHRKLLNKREIVAYQGNYIKTDQPHSDAKYALDMIYKLKGLYQEEREDLSTIYKNLTDEELNAKIKKLEEEIGIHSGGI